MDESLLRKRLEAYVMYNNFWGHPVPLGLDFGTSELGSLVFVTLYLGSPQAILGIWEGAVAYRMWNLEDYSKLNGDSVFDLEFAVEDLYFGKRRALAYRNTVKVTGVEELVEELLKRNQPPKQNQPTKVEERPSRPNLSVVVGGKT